MRGQGQRGPSVSILALAPFILQESSLLRRGPNTLQEEKGEGAGMYSTEQEKAKQARPADSLQSPSGLIFDVLVSTRSPLCRGPGRNDVGRSQNSSSTNPTALFQNAKGEEEKKRPRDFVFADAGIFCGFYLKASWPTLVAVQERLTPKAGEGTRLGKRTTPYNVGPAILVVR